MQLPRNAEDWALGLSLLSLIVASLGLLYTRRKIRQATDPEILLHASVGNQRHGSILVRINNLSTTTTVTDVEVIGYIRKHANGFRLRRRWQQFELKCIDPLPPLTTDVKVWLGSLTKIVCELFPGHLRFVSMNTDHIPNNVELPPHYQRVRDQNWEIRIVVRYRGAVAGARRVSRVARLIAEPKYKEYLYSVKKHERITHHNALFVDDWIVRSE